MEKAIVAEMGTSPAVCGQIITILGARAKGEVNLRQAIPEADFVSARHEGR